MHIGIAWPIGHQAARLDQFTIRMHSRQAALGGEVHDARTVVQEQPVRQHEQRARLLPDDCRECVVRFLFPAAYPEGQHFHPQRLSCGPRLSLVEVTLYQARPHSE